MNANDEDLEWELHALRPRALSPELQERIAASLTAAPIPAWKPRPRGRLVLGGLVAASLLTAVLWPRGPGGHIPDLPHAGPTTEVAEPVPTFRVCQHALAQSPEALDALIDKYAAFSLAANEPFKRVRAFPLTNTDLVD